MKYLKLIGSLLTGTVVFFYGKDAQVLVALEGLVFLMLMDIITGIIKGSQDKVIGIKSSIFRRGLTKKIVTLILIALLYSIQYKYKFITINANLELIAITCYAFAEIWSIIENIKVLGVLIPDSIAKYIPTSEDKSNGK